MDGFGVKDFDSVHKRCCCPIHAENTPSFIFSPKTNSCHCFGACGRNYDVIDAFMHQGLTYMQAVQKLFELAGVAYGFGELGVRTKRSYNYPKPEQNEVKDAVYAYLAKRKISKETVDYLDIRQDSKGNIAFNYYDLNDTLTMVKYRPTRKIAHGENKNWCQQGADTTPILFNMNRINVDQPLLITSGELDCAAAVESGFINAVSIPLGDGNTHWIPECQDWLEQFKEIIIAHDNDESGLKFVKEVVPRLGSWRCKIVNIPEYYEDEEGKKHSVKDINEMLYFFGKDKVLEAIVNAQDSPVPSLVDFADVEDVDLTDIDGIRFGIDALDKELMRLFYGSFTIISGTPGSGKTSFLYQLICQALDQEKNCQVYSKELPAWMSRNWLMYLLAGRRHLVEYVSPEGATYYRVKPEAKKKISDFYRGKLMLYKDDWSNDVKSIQDSMIDSVRKYGSKLFLLDNMTTIDLGANDDNKWQKQTELVNQLIQFSMKYNVCTILVCHPRKMQDLTENVGLYELSGTANLINLAHRAISLRRIGKKEKAGIPNAKGDGWVKPPCPYDVVVSVQKDRLRGRANLECGLYYDVPSRRFFTKPEEFEHNYAWDTTEYIDHVPYPVVDTEEEIFGK